MATLSIPQSDQTARRVLHPLAIPLAASLFTFVVCYFRSFIFPDIPLLPGGDQTGFVHQGSRIVAGQLPYRDYFQIVPPGTDLTYALLIKAFGLHTWIPQIAMAVLATMAAFLITLISMRVLQGLAVVLPGLFLVGLLLPESLDGTHHWFSTLVALAALLVMLDGATKLRIAVAGALCGLTACFTQTKGAAVLAGFIVYLIWKAGYDHAPGRVWLHQCLVLCVAAAAVFIVANAYFISTAGIQRWLYCIIVYPLRYYPLPVANNWRVVMYDFGWHGGAGRWIAYPFAYATVPLASVIFLVGTRRRWRDGTEPWPQLVLIALTAVFMFLAVASSPSLKRLGSVGPPAMVSLVWLLNRSGRVTRLLKTGLTAAAIGMALLQPVRTQTRWRSYLDLPAGRTAFQDKAVYDEYSWVLNHTHPGQLFYGMPMYLPFHLVNPDYVDGMDTSDYTRPEQVTELLHALDAPVPMMVLPPAKEYAHPSGPSSDHLGLFREYLCRNYRLTRTFATGDEVWERREEATDCPPQ